MRKIINITIFAIAGIACIFALVFSSGFDDKSKEKYFATSQVKEAAPEMLSDLADATVETLPDFIKKYQDVANSKSTENKKIQLHKELFYTYIVSLKDIGDNQSNFDTYVADFPSYSAKFIAEDVNAKEYMDGFTNIKSMSDLPQYITSLEDSYAIIKQDYLLTTFKIKAINSILEEVIKINSIVSKNKKEIDLKDFQKANKDYQTQESTLNVAMIGSYIIFFITIGLLLFFSVYQIAKNLKSSLGVVLGVLLLAIVAIIGCFVSSGELTEIAAKLQTTPAEMKWIGSSLIVFYFVFFGTILAIIGSLVMNTIKKIK